MALFGRKKGDAPENGGSASQNGESPKNENGAFDFDSIARDLEAQDGPSPFDALLSKPAGDNPFDIEGLPSIDEEASGSAFDFPETPPETTSAPPARTVVATSSNDLDNLDDLFGAPSTQSAKNSDTVSPAHSDSFPDTPIIAPPVTKPFVAATAIASPEPAPKARKPLPLVPIIGVVAVLAIAGGAGWFFTQGGSNEEPVPIATPLANTAENNSSESNVPDSNTEVSATAPPVDGAADTTATTQATSIAPVVTPPAATVDDPQMMTELRNLWEQGKSAKERGDYAAARQFWEQALKIKPGHPGFQESIDKLPK